jgi:hypothetical protein
MTQGDLSGIRNPTGGSHEIFAVCHRALDALCHLAHLGQLMRDDQPAGGHMKVHTQIILVLTVLFALYQLVAFPHGNATVMVGFAMVCGGLLWGAVSLGLIARKKKAALPPGFSPTYRAAHIAIDLDQTLLWVRPKRGKERVLPRSDLRRWQHEWTEVRNAMGQTYRRRHVITFNVADLDEPTFEVPFKSDEEAETWHARISAWANG